MAKQLTLPPPVRGQWIPMTSDKFDAWVPDGMQAEWVNGNGIIFEAISERHNVLGTWFGRLLATFLDVSDLGTLYGARFEMRLLDGASRRQPDLFVVLYGRRHLMREFYFDGPADFVTEFVSKRNASIDRVDKFHEFAAAGVPEYLMVDADDPGRDAELYRNTGTGGLERVMPDSDGHVHSAILPGFWFDSVWFRRNPLQSPEVLMFEIAPEAYRSYLNNIFYDRSM